MVLCQAQEGELKGFMRMGIMLHPMASSFSTPIILMYLILAILWRRYVGRDFWCGSRFFWRNQTENRYFNFLRVFLTGREGIIPSRCVCNSKGKETAYSKLVFSVLLSSSEENLNWNYHPFLLKNLHGKSLSLQDQEQSLLDAIAKLDEASDGESGKLPCVS